MQQTKKVTTISAAMSSKNPDIPKRTYPRFPVNTAPKIMTIMRINKISTR
jgi:hypothetical protein